MRAVAGSQCAGTQQKEGKCPEILVVFMHFCLEASHGAPSASGQPLATATRHTWWRSEPTAKRHDFGLAGNAPQPDFVPVAQTQRLCLVNIALPDADRPLLHARAGAALYARAALAGNAGTGGALDRTSSGMPAQLRARPAIEARHAMLQSRACMFIHDALRLRPRRRLRSLL